MSEAPRRIQLSRAKGWRMPPNTVKVDRTTKWGNPFVVGKSGGAYTGGRAVQDRRHAWRLYQAIAPDNDALVAAARAELRGKNLACWCPLDDPYQDVCHAAVLLEIANAPDGEAIGPSSTTEADEAPGTNTKILNTTTDPKASGTG